MHPNIRRHGHSLNLTRILQAVISRHRPQELISASSKENGILFLTSGFVSERGPHLEVFSTY